MQESRVAELVHCIHILKSIIFKSPFLILLEIKLKQNTKKFEFIYSCLLLILFYIYATWLSNNATSSLHTIYIYMIFIQFHSIKLLFKGNPKKFEFDHGLFRFYRFFLVLFECAYNRIYFVWRRRCRTRINDLKVISIFVYSSFCGSKRKWFTWS